MHSGERDAIHIEQLEVSARVGVTAEERQHPQRLTVSITMWPKVGFEPSEDDLARTIDYSAICSGTRDFVARTEYKLIETLAVSLAEILLGQFPIQQVRIELRKFVLPNAEYAAVRVTRTASNR